MRRLFVVAALSSLFSLSAFDGVTGAEVVLEIDGKQLTLLDIERKNSARLFQARNAFYESEKKAVEEFIDTYLLETHAKKQNLTVAQLLERDVNSKVGSD